MLKKVVEKILQPDYESRKKARERLEKLTMPYWALGRLMDLAEDLCGIKRECPPNLKNKTIVIMAGDHGITEEGVSLYPKEVTPQMIYNFVNGGAGINALSNLNKTRIKIVDVGVAAGLEDLKEKIISKKVMCGTHNMRKEPAMSGVDAFKAIETGIEVAMELSNDTDVFGTGDMGIGNTTPSAAIASVITGKSPEEIAGKGTGIDDEKRQHKVAIIEECIMKHNPNPDDPIDILSKVGGLEIGAIAGLILGAASLQKPVVIDGFISGAAALIAYKIAPATKNYMIASHLSQEKGHHIILEFLGLKPFLDLHLRLGEGTGAAMAMNLIDAAGAVLTQIATFEEASVSGPK